MDGDAVALSPVGRLSGDGGADPGDAAPHGARRLAGGLFHEGLLFLEPTINHEADTPKQQVRHAHHQVNALVVRPRLVVVLLTEGLFVAGLSGRAGVDGARIGEQNQEGKGAEKNGKPAHC